MYIYVPQQSCADTDRPTYQAAPHVSNPPWRARWQYLPPPAH